MDCDDPRCGAVFPQQHVPECRNAARPPKGRSSWDADMAEARPTGIQAAIDSGTAAPSTYAGLTLDLPVYINATEADLALYLGGMT